MTQLALPGFEHMTAGEPRPRRRRSAASREAAAPDSLTRIYVRRLAARGAAPKGISAYRYQVRATVRAASRLAGGPVTVLDLFKDETLLGHALVDDAGAADGPQLSMWTLAQRRSAIRSFAMLMRPELLPLLGEEPGRVVDRALRGSAERVGGGYRLSGGAPRRRGGTAPSREEVAAVLDEVGRAPGFEGARNRSFFGVLAATGSRVNALRRLDGADCIALPSGRLRLYLHEKGKAERREVELGADAARDLRAYVEAFNRHAARRGLRARVRLGEPGAVWRNLGGVRWGYPAVLGTLRAGCVGAGIPPFAPHALRRAFASDAASVLPRHLVARAGGWKGLERLDDHYVRPREATIWEKLSHDCRQAPESETEVGATDAAARAL